jgi:hypothetical protein
MRRGGCTPKDFQNLFSCELINEVGAAAVTRLLVSLADSMSFLGSSTTSKLAADRGRIIFFPQLHLFAPCTKSTEPSESPPTNSQGRRLDDEAGSVYTRSETIQHAPETGQKTRTDTSSTSSTLCAATSRPSA